MRGGFFIEKDMLFATLVAMSKRSIFGREVLCWGLFYKTLKLSVFCEALRFFGQRLRRS
jgi:hypothetical protein